MQELKPCPCCGAAIGLYVLQDEKYGEWRVFCDMCKTSFHNENHCDTREEAISAWNRRAERTCRFKTNQEPEGGEVWSECGECGAQFGWDYWQCIESASYCPNCGGLIEVVYE